MIVDAVWGLVVSLITTILTAGGPVTMPSYLATTPVGTGCGTGVVTLGCLSNSIGQKLAYVDNWLPVGETLDAVPFVINAVLALFAIKFALRIYGLIRGGGGE